MRYLVDGYSPDPFRNTGSYAIYNFFNNRPSMPRMGCGCGCSSLWGYGFGMNMMPMMNTYLNGMMFGSLLSSLLGTTNSNQTSA
ncbi:MAG: hypothetical protein LKG27_05000 [Clostridiaceae bacterium]|jgi:hypothetical protein|nr:hypothetical protein [Clostridiaceae bacterium]